MLGTNAYPPMLRDPTNGLPLTNPVVVRPCRHVFNNTTALEILATSKLCPHDGQKIERFEEIKILTNLRPSNQPSPEAVATEDDSSATDHQLKVACDASDHTKLFGTILGSDEIGYIQGDDSSDLTAAPMPKMTLAD